MIALLSFALFITLPDSTMEAETVAQAQSALLAYIQPFDSTPDAGRWPLAWADLNGDGLKDAVALSNDADWCGSGGCTLLILEAIPEVDQEELGPFRVAAEVSMVDAPVVWLGSRANGWHDLGVTDEEGRTIRLSFDGETYPFSPADGTKARVNAGRVLFAGTE